MNTLRQDHYLKVERQRKQDLYRQMLDQQIRYKTQNKEQNSNLPKRSSNDQIYVAKNQYSHPQRTNSYRLPSIGNVNPLRPDRREIYNQKVRSYDQDDNAQIYLSNCQEIIKNLRDLKEKKKHKQSNYSYQISPATNKANSVDVQYYPKPRYFSNGLPFNKISPTESHEKAFKPRPSKMFPQKLKTLQVDKSTPTKQNESIIRSKKAKNRKNIKLTAPDKQHDNKGKERQQQTQQPSGILQEKQISKKPSKKKANLIKVFPPTQFTKQPVNQKQNDVQNKISRQQLLQCLNQLIKYLKIKNNQTKVSSNLNTPPVQSENIQVQQHAESSPSKDYDSARNSINQSQIGNLKYKAMVILRKLNKQSQQLVKKVHQNKNNNKTFQQNQIDNQSQLQRQEDHYKTPDQSRVGETNQNQTSNALVEIMKTHLNSEDNKDEDFSRCVKEMTQYLKNQPQQKKQTSPQDAISQYQQDKLLNHDRHAEIGTKDNATKLREAVLKRLKKARMRGSLFQQKIQNFRQQHSKHYKKAHSEQIDSGSNDPLKDTFPSLPQQSLNPKQQPHNNAEQLQ